MMYLLDTNVISEMRKTERAHAKVKKWAGSVDATALFLSAVSVLEMEIGVCRIERRDRKQGLVLRTWVQTRVVPRLGGGIIAVETQVALKCAALPVPDPRSYRDSLIAASAIIHEMTVVTRNIADFEPMGVAVLNPWEF